jgi:hypothetical protein
VLYPGAPALQDLLTMNGDNGPDISAALDDLPVQQRGEVARISMQDSARGSRGMLSDIVYHMLYHMQ